MKRQHKTSEPVRITTVRLTPRHHRDLHELARRGHRNISSEIRLLIEREAERVLGDDAEAA